MKNGAWRMTGPVRIKTHINVEANTAVLMTNHEGSRCISAPKQITTQPASFRQERELRKEFFRVAQPESQQVPLISLFGNGNRILNEVPDLVRRGDALQAQFAVGVLFKFADAPLEGVAGFR